MTNNPNNQNDKNQGNRQQGGQDQNKQREAQNDPNKRQQGGHQDDQRGGQQKRRPGSGRRAGPGRQGQAARPVVSGLAVENDREPRWITAHFETARSNAASDRRVAFLFGPNPRLASP